MFDLVKAKLEGVRAVWIDGNESKALLLFIFHMGHVLNGELSVIMLLQIDFNRLLWVLETEHVQAIEDVLLISIDEIPNAEHELLIDKILQGLFANLLISCFLLLSEWLGENGVVVVPLLLVLWNFDEVLVQPMRLRASSFLRWLQVLADNIIRSQLKPFLMPLKEDDLVLVMQGANVIRAVVRIDDAIINLELLAVRDRLAAAHLTLAVVIELECLDEVGRIVCVLLVCLDDWHVTLLGLDDFHGLVEQVVFVVLGQQETLNLDSLHIVTIRVLGFVVSIGLLEVCLLGIFDDVRVFHVIFEVGDLHAPPRILRCLDRIGQHFLNA